MGQNNVNRLELRLDRAIYVDYNTPMLMEKLAGLAVVMKEDTPAGALTKTLLRYRMKKEAIGKMLEVGFRNLRQDSQPQIKTSRGIVYMPDCEKYRNIIKNGTPEEHAALVQKFMLNLSPDVHFASCDAYIIEKK